MKNKKKLIFGGVALIFVAFIAIAIVNSQKTKQASAEAGMKVETKLVTTDTIEATVSVKGAIEPYINRQLYSSSVAKIDTLFVNEGDTVKKGDVLLSFDKDDITKMESKYRQAEINMKIQDINNDNTDNKLKSSVDEAKQRVNQLDNSLKESRIALKDARQTLTNNQALYDAGAISKSQLESSQKAVETFERKVSLDSTSLQNAKNQLGESQKDYMTALSADPNKSVQQLQLELQKLSISELESSLKELKEGIKAPISGTVLSLDMKEGYYISNTAPIMTIGDLSKKKVTLQINEFDAPLLALDQNVSIRSQAINGKKFHGKVTAIGAQAKKTRQGNSEVQTVTIEVTIIDDASELKPGFTVNCDVELEKRENIVVVPIQSALKDKDGSYFVYIVNDDNLIEKKTITLGLFSESNIEAKGIEEGVEIVFNPSPLLKDGDKVSPELIQDAEGAENNDQN